MNTLKTRVLALCLFTAIAGASGAASAKGCLTGAAVGGAAGHVAGKHGMVGAAAGCAIGHHHAKKKAEQANANAQQTQNVGQNGAANTSTAPATNR